MTARDEELADEAAEEAIIEASISEETALVTLFTKS
jgi:hypothetical protein